VSERHHPPQWPPESPPWHSEQRTADGERQRGTTRHSGGAKRHSVGATRRSAFSLSTLHMARAYLGARERRGARAEEQPSGIAVEERDGRVCAVAVPLPAKDEGA
jgi:hypothetical protein